MIVNCLNQYLSDAPLKKGAPSKTILSRGHRSVGEVRGEKGGHRFSAMMEEI
jgi:hypothetical protein